MTRTKVHPCGILRAPFDIVCNALVNCTYSPERSVKKYMFYKCCHISRPSGPHTCFLVHSTGNFITKTRSYTSRPNAQRL